MSHASGKNLKKPRRFDSVGRWSIADRPGCVFSLHALTPHQGPQYQREGLEALDQDFPPARPCCGDITGLTDPLQKLLPGTRFTTRVGLLHFITLPIDTLHTSHSPAPDTSPLSPKGGGRDHTLPPVLPFSSSHCSPPATD